MNQKEFLRFLTILATTNADDPDVNRVYEFGTTLMANLKSALARAEAAEALAYERLENMLFAEQRANDAEIERDEAVARAEAAEAEVRDLRDRNNNLTANYANFMKSALEASDIRIRSYTEAAEQRASAAQAAEIERDAAQNSLALADKATAIATALAAGYQQRAVAAETARDSCYHAAAEMSGWLSTANKAVEVVSARAAELDAELAAVRFAANMPDDYEYGLPSWIRQYLYASYIGASFSEAVLNQIREGRLTFPEAPIYKRAAELEAALAAERAAHQWRPVTEKPPSAGRYLVWADENVQIGVIYERAWLTLNGARVLSWQPLPAAPEEPAP